VQWMATEACALRCPHCLCGDDRARDELSLRETETLLEQVAAMGVRELLVTGGEPLLREDLPEVIDGMGRLSIRWSLNTSASPSEAVRRAMERHPPAFVAVSVDGPERVHDAFRGREGSFRECMEAIAFFKEITGGNVAAGTTLSSFNVGHLEETFHAVLASGASSWGLHLTFPEGRARGRPDLFLSKKQVRGLLDFVARTRRCFPVTLADEIGYTGEWEPELRPSPFFCGAGRAQCVVLSDGEVVPCTTTDRSRSAGSIRRSSLEEIWRRGFADLRGSVALPRECRRCDFLPLCGGGCWLQRRGGMQCFKEAWLSPGSLKIAAGLAVCLGLSSALYAGLSAEAGRPSAADETLHLAKTAAKGEKAQTKGKTAKLAKSGALEDAVLEWVLESSGRSSWFKGPNEVKSEAGNKELSADPAGKYLAQIKGGKYPKDLGKRTKRIKAALKTDYRSLAFASLLWRDLMLWCLKGTEPSKRTDEEKSLLRETLGALEKKAQEWRLEIFEKKLDAFVSGAPSGRHSWFMMSKAFLPHEAFRSAKAHLSMEHWGLQNYMDEVTAEHVKQHPFGESMRVEIEVAGGAGVKKVSGKGSADLKSKDHVDIFGVLVVPACSAASISVTSGGQVFKADLPAGTELLYGDILRLLYEQKSQAMDEIADKASSGWELADPRSIYLPALEKRIAGLKPDEASTKDALMTTALSIWLF
jgi:radical SAM protein with 4Fe4S-binding SPASM domain